MNNYNFSPKNIRCTFYFMLKIDFEWALPTLRFYTVTNYRTIRLPNQMDVFV